MKLREWGYFIVFKFDVELGTKNMYRFVEKLKQVIPTEQRDYIEETKEWWIENTDKNIAILEALRNHYFGDME